MKDKNPVVSVIKKLFMARAKGTSLDKACPVFTNTPYMLAMFVSFFRSGQQWHEFARGGSAVIIFGREKISCWPTNRAPILVRLAHYPFADAMFARPLCPLLPVPLVSTFA